MILGFTIEAKGYDMLPRNMKISTNLHDIFRTQLERISHTGERNTEQGPVSSSVNSSRTAQNPSLFSFLLRIILPGGGPGRQASQICASPKPIRRHLPSRRTWHSEGEVIRREGCDYHHTKGRKTRGSESRSALHSLVTSYTGCSPDVVRTDYIVYICRSGGQNVGVLVPLF